MHLKRFRSFTFPSLIPLPCTVTTISSWQRRFAPPSAWSNGPLQRSGAMLRNFFSESCYGRGKATTLGNRPVPTRFSLGRVWFVADPADVLREGNDLIHPDLRPGAAHRREVWSCGGSFFELPVHGSVRAAFSHTALTLGVWRRSARWIGMQDLGNRNPPVGRRADTLPAHAMPLTASP